MRLVQSATHAQTIANVYTCTGVKLTVNETPLHKAEAKVLHWPWSIFFLLLKKWKRAKQNGRNLHLQHTQESAVHIWHQESEKKSSPTGVFQGFKKTGRTQQEAKNRATAPTVY